jgi:hypothetical protein
MTSRKDERDEHADRADAAAARTYWLAEQLGEHWHSDGDGVYRFVDPEGVLSDPAGEEELHDAHAPLTRDPSEPEDSGSKEHPRHWRIPWRRH